jgi:UDPglucose 6-dehydrogenase
MTITFIGHGYVGLVSAAVFADLGNTVWVIGHTPEKIEKLKKGIIPIYEPGLDELVKRNVDAGRLLFTLDYDEAIPSSDVVYIAVGTPPKENGEADLSVVFEVAKKLAGHLSGYTVIITKSTVPVGTNFEVKRVVEESMTDGAEIDVASVPEFLREGQAISDTRHPDRVVIGVASGRAREVLEKLHEPIDATKLITDIQTAEMIKYASNAFLATKISFANAVAQLSEKVGADGVGVLEGVGLDTRIGSNFLKAGAGYGGSCFPKDVKALIAISKDHNFDFNLLKEFEKINAEASNSIVAKAKTLLGDVKDKKIAVLGLAFKPDTDDMRDAPSLIIIPSLLSLGAKVSAYDPIAQDNAKRLLKNEENIEFVESALDTVKDADLLILTTEWDEFRQLDMGKVVEAMRQANLIDGRNIYDPEEMKALGFNYLGVGR